MSSIRNAYETAVPSFHVTPRTFARQFRDAFGTTPAAYVEALRVQAAQDRLSSTTAPVKQVGGSVGFGSAEVFGRAFQRRLGVTPAAYRAGFSLAGQTPFTQESNS